MGLPSIPSQEPFSFQQLMAIPACPLVYYAGRSPWVEFVNAGFRQKEVAGDTKPRRFVRIPKQHKTSQGFNGGGCSLVVITIVLVMMAIMVVMAIKVINNTSNNCNGSHK